MILEKTFTMYNVYGLQIFYDQTCKTIVFAPKSLSQYFYCHSDGCPFTFAYNHKFATLLWPTDSPWCFDPSCLFLSSCRTTQNGPTPR